MLGTNLTQLILFFVELCFRAVVCVSLLKLEFALDEVARRCIRLKEKSNQDLVEAFRWDYSGQGMIFLKLILG